MKPDIQRLSLAPAAPGTRRELLVLRYGKPGAGPKAYIQASLHADETPGMMAAHHLRRLLSDVEVLGEIVLVPYANPIGLSQIVFGDQQGRFELGGKGNFNRDWPDLHAAVAARLEGQLGKDPARNRKVILAAFATHLHAWDPVDEVDSLKKALCELAFNAETVLDLHCDNEALAHLYIQPHAWEEAAAFAADLGCHGVMTAEDSGGGSFDECFSAPWVRIARDNPKAAIPAPPFSTTVELRGESDVSDELGERDAQAILNLLMRRGVVAGEPPAPAKALCEATDLRGMEILTSPIPGFVTYRAALGERVARGQVVAEVIDPAAEDLGRARLPIHAGTDGIVLSRRAHKWVAPGQTIAKVVGKEPIEGREGYLLEN